MMTSRFTAGAASVTIAVALVIPAAASTSAAAAPLCTTDSLSLSTTAPGSPGDSTQIHFNAVFTNISSQSCALQGYPGVDLLGPDDPMWGPDYQLPQQSGDPQLVTMSPGASAISRLTFVVTPDGWVPRTISATLPNTSGQLQTSWTPGGIPIARQDGATHPGSYVGPFQVSD